MGADRQHVGGRSPSPGRLRSIAVVAVVLYGSFAYASGGSSPDLRISFAGDKFSNTRQIAAAFDLPAPAVLRARNLEIAVGSITSSQGNEAFISFGPVWRVPISRHRLFIDFGFSPTLFSSSSFNGRDLGGNFHFTSSVSVGTVLGRRRAAAISLRIQHTSNGGLHSTNPGMDMIGVNFSLGTN